MLARRGDKAAWPFVRSAVDSASDDVRLAAIPAVPALGGAEGLVALWPILKTGSEAEIRAVHEALLLYPAEAVVPDAVRLLAEATPAGRAVLIELLGGKGRRRAYRTCPRGGPERRIVRPSRGVSRTRLAVAAIGNLAPHRPSRRIDRLRRGRGDPVGRRRRGRGRASPRKQGGPLARDLREPESRRKSRDPAASPPPARPPRPRGGRRGNKEPGYADSGRRPVYALFRWPDMTRRQDRSSNSSRRRRTGSSSFSVSKVTPGWFPNPACPARRNSPSSAMRSRSTGRKRIRSPSFARSVSVRTMEAFLLLAYQMDSPGLETDAARALFEVAAYRSPRNAGSRPISRFPSCAGPPLFSQTPENGTPPGRRSTSGCGRADSLRLFDGRSLAGWKGLVADPPKRAKMTPEELRAAQAEADERMRAHWRVEDGALRLRRRRREPLHRPGTSGISSFSPIG